MPVAPRRLFLCLLGLLALPGLAPAGEFILQPLEVAETKALFGQIESRFVVPARSRIGGTITALDVTEGDEVDAGQVIARIVDEKLDLQLAAAEARLAAARSQLDNARSELARSESLLERGSTTVQAVDRVRTSVTVARNAVTELDSGKAVILQQMAEGDVKAPAGGRVLSIPTRLGEVVLPGEAVATIAAGQVFLRLAIPERHANGLSVGDRVAIGDGADPRGGRIEKVYPLIENGRVTVDVAVDGLSGAFIGQRVLVQVPVGTRQALAVPQAAIRRSAGLDLVAISTGGAARTVTVVPGPVVATPDGPMVEILSGLRAGDTVILP
ncbi:MAG: efflux RND transporter periplasmic adaptor subunit [Rhodobacter sp.]|jgi:multidrug efflux system membrane fusion protein|nr:efflux RND transporter periplasmic adaptor subunit [Rhodobacter sp.]MCA3492340.1 efflux RND transporter periplasmic adaptor subunit [Rhodobacter sp.]MCA3501405.1 efflux RND transporter periplasmic adaptor subunit [Rhodobacter sp.]MCA3502603.1 efflux RND transporter periplasmic adaptor subunit [Rhodobacter sp.]MCA3516075.1 efflux RND transporter periplasmic adaptor subunit [Rhodobacter sp.]